MKENKHGKTPDKTNESEREQNIQVSQEQEIKEKVEVDILQSQEEDTPAKTEYRALLAKYKQQNPVKYERKKGDFARKLRGDVMIEYSNDGKRKTFVFANTPPRDK